MQIVINGEDKEISSPATLRDLIQKLDLKEDRIAVELNREIVRRDRWAQTQLQAKDQLEIVQFVGGG
jgi:sulfur carrier protein